MDMTQTNTETQKDGQDEYAVLDLHDKNAAKVGVDRDGRARPTRFSWIIPLLASLLVGLAFLASLAGDPTAETGPVQEISAKIFSDIGNVLASQFKTFGLIALYALIPGIFGSIYRKKFWHWFVIAYIVMFAFNLIGFLGGERSISSDIIAKLNYPYWTYVRGEAVLLAVFLIDQLKIEFLFQQRQAIEGEEHRHVEAHGRSCR